MKRYWIALCLMVACWPAAAQSAKIGHLDFHGNVRVVEASHAAATQSAPHPSGATVHAGGITFDVTYMDVVNHNGHGFDDPVLGATRRSTFEAVLSYIGSVLGDSGGCTITWDVSQLSGSGGSGGELASAGAFYTEVNGFTGGHALEHITTGVDSFPTVPDIEGTVDFGFNWNNGMGAPAAGQDDLFSVLLHELTHGLGLASLSNPDGSSAFAAADHVNTFTRWDQLLYTGNGTQLWSGPGTFNGTASDLVGLGGGVLFHGTHATSVLGTFPRVYAPNPYQPGSSIAHWNDATFASNPPVMAHAITVGTEPRAYRPFEIGALQDVGYKIRSTTTNAAHDWPRWR